MPDDTHALLKLILAGGPAASRRALLDMHQTPTRSLAAGAPAWRAAGLAEVQIQRLRQPPPEELQRSLDWLEQPGRRLLGFVRQSAHQVGPDRGLAAGRVEPVQHRFQILPRPVRKGFALRYHGGLPP